MAQQQRIIPSHAGLALELRHDDFGMHPRAMVVCHPLPTAGGSMDNKVVTTVQRAAQLCDMPCVRFNFRGVGNSTGTFDNGVGETTDLQSTVAWLANNSSVASILLAGFSFGAAVALRGVEMLALPVWHLLLVAPPIGVKEYVFTEQLTVPATIIQGDADEIVDANNVFKWSQRCVPAPQVVRMVGASHFFHRRLVELRQHVIDEVLRPAQKTLTK